MKDKEAKARIKINQLLVDAGWRFFDENGKKANIQLEPNVKIKQAQIDSMGEDFDKVKNGFVDYLLLDEKSNPLLVLEAKRAGKHPLDGKEQARAYANSLRAKYIILSNGDIHYFWNLSKGNPEIITVFPSYEDLIDNKALISSVRPLIDTHIDKYYIALSQEPGLENSRLWLEGNEEERDEYCLSRNLRLMRYYQLQAVRSIQTAVKEGKTRFLFEMATGTGKTLTSAAVIKLFLRSEVVNRCLFLVDRIELENQAMKDFKRYLSKDGIKVIIYKENKDDWNAADVVISTIQSFSVGDKYRTCFNPSDFDLVVSDESHRTLGASNRAIFEYFIGYKLGLTATPKNYLKGVQFGEEDPRELERRVLLDTYHTFGCDSGTATYSYTLLDGVRDGYLISPTVVDARSDITTQLLSDKGLIFKVENEEEQTEEVQFNIKSYEKKFFSESTNYIFCETFLRNALRDPISGEIGKAILFCVSINHARKITQILNEIADKMFPGKYNSDFAVQITSNVENAQQMTINYSNNNLNGKTNWLDGYESCKTRVAVTVAMMTTGYDCSDILNLGFLRPVFSPSDFIQMKGRGTRTHTFKYDGTEINKETFKIFDFFAVCDYFENDFNYDEKIVLPKERGSGFGSIENDSIKNKIYNSKIQDSISTYAETEIGSEGMKIDRKFYQSFEDKVNNDSVAQELINIGDAERLESYLVENVFDKPVEFFSVKKLEQALGLDRHLSIKELVQYLLGKIDKICTKDEMIMTEYGKFCKLYSEDLSKYMEVEGHIHVIFEAFLTDGKVREAIRERRLQDLINSPLAKDIRSVRNVFINNKRFIEVLADYVAANDINCENLSI